MKNLKKGFTLIELLVVVAIIGILASVVLDSLGSARNKGDDTAVKANLRTVQNQAALFYSEHGNSYGGSTSGTCPIFSGPIYNSSMFSADGVVKAALVEAIKRGNGSSSCYNSADAWAVAVGLKSTKGSWCADSEGAAREVSVDPKNAINGTSFVCN